MYPNQRSLVARTKDKPFALIGINSDKDLMKLKTRLQEEKITWRSFWNGPLGTDGPLSQKWNVSAWPTTFVLDHKGVIRGRDMRESEAEKLIDKLVAEAN